MKYRKLPVVIEAHKLEVGEKSMASIMKFTNGKATPSTEGGMTIPTLEGVMTANLGDFIIQGVNGEFYPCKPEIFEKTYEAVGKRMGCGCCGGYMVSIRGKYPKEPDRDVCPTCISERLDNIREISSPHYGIAVMEGVDQSDREDVLKG